MSFSRGPFHTAWRLFGLAFLVGASVVHTTAQPPLLPPPPALPDCADLDRLGIPKQMNLRAAAAMVACGRAVPGEADELGVERETLIGGNVDTITGTETSPHVTQSEHQIWANGTTVVVHYNDSRDAPSNFSGVSYSTDGGATYTRIIPS